MKMTLKNLILLSIVGIFQFSCDPSEVLDELTTVTINTDLPKTFSMSVPDGGHLADVSITKTIQASSNESINQFESKIDSYSVDSLLITITNYDGGQDVSLDEATITFKNASSGNIVEPITLITEASKLNLMAASNSGEAITYQFDPSIAEAIAGSFLEENELTIQVTGSVDGSPVSFDMEAVLYVQVTGKLVQMDQQ